MVRTVDGTWNRGYVLIIYPRLGVFIRNAACRVGVSRALAGGNRYAGDLVRIRFEMVPSSRQSHVPTDRIIDSHILVFPESVPRRYAGRCRIDRGQHRDIGRALFGALAGIERRLGRIRRCKARVGARSFAYGLATSFLDAVPGESYRHADRTTWHADGKIVTKDRGTVRTASYYRLLHIAAVRPSNHRWVRRFLTLAELDDAYAIITPNGRTISNGSTGAKG